MSYKKILLLFSFSVVVLGALAQEDSEKVLINNGVIKREIIFSKGQLLGKSYQLKAKGTEFINSETVEFSLQIDDVLHSGKSKWTNLQIKDTTDIRGGQGTIISVDRASDGLVSLDIIYMTYPKLPVVRKAIRVKNSGSKDIKVEAVDVESFQIKWNCIETWLLRHYARHKWYGPFEGDWNDPLVVLHDLDNDKGIAVGNEADGVTKRTSAFMTDKHTVTVGLTHPHQDNNFRKWIKPNESWLSPWAFTVLYEDAKDPSFVVNTSVQDYVRRHMGVRIEEIKSKPTFAYNTWYPFFHNINEELIKDLAKAAAESGVEEFIIDDGWQVNIDRYDGHQQLHGDWEVDKKKFPNGLRPVFDYIKSLGMKPGLWVTLTTADPSSKVYKEHPEWFIVDKKGELANLHTEDGLSRTACLGTDWYNYIKDVILRLVDEHGLAYLKLDLAIVTSAYVFDNTRTGCYATNHEHHKDREESYAAIYARCMELFDEIHEIAPDLYIDCTYETVGKLNVVDYGVVKHAEGDWLSNILQSGPLGPLRMRNLAWERTLAIPATSMLIGNLTMNDEYHELAFKSLAGTLPIMLGDPRKLSKEERARFKSWATWLRKLEDQHEVMSFRQDLPGFGEPAEGAWDAYARLNTETNSGGFIGVFRHGSKEQIRLVTIPWLADEMTYVVKQGYGNHVVATMSGKELKERGFSVTLSKDYDGELFEITSIKK